jgi:type IV secretion system protein VirD4
MNNIFEGITRGIPGKSPREMSPTASSFEDPARIASSKNLQYTPDKMFLGVINAEIKSLETGERYTQGGVEIGVDDDRHMMTIAGSRSGKGRSAIIPNMLRYQGSVLAIDPKGELAMETAVVRAEKLGQKVYVIDPFGTTRKKLELTPYKCGFNPMDMMQEEKGVENSILITDALVVQEDSDPHWNESARTFIEALILEVATAARFKGRRNLITVRDLLAQGDSVPDLEDGEALTGFDILEGYMRESNEEAVVRGAADFFEREDRERNSVLSTARRHLRALSFPEIAASLNTGDLNLAELKTGAVTIYLCLPGRHMGTCGRWLRLFVNLALQAMERTEGKPAAGCPVLFVLDEFASLGRMGQIEDAAGQIAGYGVKLWPILQDLGQLKALYKERWETFMGNAGVLQFFGNNDLTTLEWISKRLGSTTIEQLSGSAVTPGAGRAGAVDGYSPQTIAILEPDEIAMVFGRANTQLRQLIIRAGFAPMILQKAYYDKHDAFKELRK